MALASWPDNLPYRPNGDGWANNLGIAPMVGDVDGPAAEQRSRPGDGIETITWSRAVSRAEFAILRAFVMGTLRHGAARFWMPVTLDRSTYGIRTVQIVSGSFTAVGINNAQVRVSMSLTVYPPSWVPPVPVITSVGSAITGTAANGSPVEVSIGSTVFSTTATSGDVWFLTVPWLADGIYDVRARIVIGGSPGPWGIPWQLTMPTPRIAAMREMMRGGPGLVADFLAGDALIEGGPSFYGAVNGLPGLTFSRASAATRINAAGDMESVGAGVLRYDHDPVTLAPRGVLIEPARTNLAVHSCAIGTAPWGATAIGSVVAPTVTPNNAYAPDTNMTGTRIVMPAVPAGASNGSRVGITISGLNAGNYTFSLWLRGATGSEFVYISATTNAVSYVRRLCALAIAWSRFDIQISIPTNGAAYYFQIGTDLRDTAQSATAAQTIYAWGAQLESGLQATSLIITGATTATRAADVLTIPTSAMPNSASEGTLYVECWRDAGPSTESACPISLYGPGRIEVNQNSLQNVYGYSGGWTLTGPTLARGTIIRAAQAWSAAAGAAMSVNGAAPSTGSVSVIPSVSQLRIGSSGAGFSWEGHIRRAVYLPRRLANTELQAITA